MSDEEVRVEFIRLCRLLAEASRKYGVRLGNISFALADNQMIIIQVDGYLTICDEITGMEFDYVAARKHLPMVRKAAVLEMLADI